MKLRSSPVSSMFCGSRKNGLREAVAGLGWGLEVATISDLPCSKRFAICGTGNDLSDTTSLGKIGGRRDSNAVLIVKGGG